MTAIRAETDQVKAELRRQVTTAFSGNARGIANAWQSMIFPRVGQSLRPAGLVFTKVPNVTDAFERGALIQAKGAKVPGNPDQLQRGARQAGGVVVERMRLTACASRPLRWPPPARPSLGRSNRAGASCGACRCARVSRPGDVAGPVLWRAA
jgi:hypothetical protein